MELLQKALFNLPRATGATGGATAGDISRSRKSYFTFNIQILRNYDTHLHASKIVDNIKYLILGQFCSNCQHCQLTFVFQFS